MKPVLLVIAGPNGSGKTTVTVRLRAERWSEGVEYLNPDEIAQSQFGDWNSPEAVLNAARWTADRREELLASGRGIAFETVMSAPDTPWSDCQGILPSSMRVPPEIRFAPAN